MKPVRLSEDVHSQLTEVQAKVGDDLARFPDFLILGPQRTGTSWLNKHLAAHPEVYLPREKETYFFSTLLEPQLPKFQYPRLDDYLSLAMKDSWRVWAKKQARSLASNFRAYRPKIFGEATASYATLDPKVIGEICLLNPEVKAVLTLREPTERVWSHAKKALTEHTDRSVDEIEFEEFDKFLRAGGQLKKGRYSEMIANWTAELKTGNLLVLEFGAVKDNPEALVTQVLKFLGAEHQKFPSRRKLAKRIYSTDSAKIPKEIEARIDELYADAQQDFEKVLGDVKKGEVASGCYIL